MAVCAGANSAAAELSTVDGRATAVEGGRSLALRDNPGTTSVPDRIAVQLEKEVLEQRFESDARSALRTELIERFGVSANAMNEALRILRERGVIHVKP